MWLHMACYLHKNKMQEVGLAGELISSWLLDDFIKRIGAHRPCKRMKRAPSLTWCSWPQGFVSSRQLKSALPCKEPPAPKPHCHFLVLRNCSSIPFRISSRNVLAKSDACEVSRSLCSPPAFMQSSVGYLDPTCMRCYCCKHIAYVEAEAKCAPLEFISSTILLERTAKRWNVLL